MVSNYLRSARSGSQYSKFERSSRLHRTLNAGPILASTLRRQYEATNKSPGEETIVITILLVILVLMLVGVVPAWPHSRNWGYAPSSTVGLLVLILLILLITGRV